MQSKGLLITFEGGDGAGKTTLIEGMYSHLLSKHKPVLKTRAPGSTKVGEVIRSLLLHRSDVPLEGRCELFLFLADRAQHMEEIILPALNAGKIVLCDRFNDSTVAYQGVARGLDPVWVRSLCKFATKGVEPDLTFYLDIDPKVGLQRATDKEGRKDRIESEALSFHEKIRSAFHSIAKQEPKRVVVLSGMDSPEQVLTQALESLYAIFPSHR